MKFSQFTRFTGAIVMCTAVSGCFGTTGTTTTTPGASTYSTAYAAAQGQIQTQTPLTGTASYSGRTHIDLPDANNAGQNNGYLEGDLDLTIDFDAANNPISGTASNFTGELDGAATSATGTLTTAASSGVNAISATTTILPVIGSITTTGLIAGLNGDLTDVGSGTTSNVELGLIGTFTGNNGSGAFGAASAVVQTAGQANVITSGTFYLD